MSRLLPILLAAAGGYGVYRSRSTGAKLLFGALGIFGASALLESNRTLSGCSTCTPPSW